jgi:hypothetical protein
MNALPLETGGNTYLYNFSKYHIAVKVEEEATNSNSKCFDADTEVDEGAKE